MPVRCLLHVVDSLRWCLAGPLLQHLQRVVLCLNGGPSSRLLPLVIFMAQCTLDQKRTHTMFLAFRGAHRRKILRKRIASWHSSITPIRTRIIPLQRRSFQRSMKPISCSKMMRSVEFLICTDMRALMLRKTVVDLAGSISRGSTCSASSPISSIRDKVVDKAPGGRDQDVERMSRCPSKFHSWKPYGVVCTSSRFRFSTHARCARVLVPGLEPQPQRVDSAVVGDRRSEMRDFSECRLFAGLVRGQEKSLLIPVLCVAARARLTRSTMSRSTSLQELTPALCFVLVVGGHQARRVAVGVTCL
mmetsp:Transcript_3643/g.8599  ORF Transcript_3643/g.8599 Transcript_3643/m.8599 type:complete len:303 (+) Transcript_3643:53-961(+)